MNLPNKNFYYKLAAYQLETINGMEQGDRTWVYQLILTVSCPESIMKNHIHPIIAQS